MDELTIGDKKYISTKRAAEITGYAKDYVGQLCREGHVEAKMVGRSWYVLESSIRAHRFGVEETVEEHIAEEALVSALIEETKPDMEATWERPRYTSETPAQIPTLTQALQTPAPTPSVPTLSDQHETAHSLDMSDTQRSIADMQEAWKEWFESRKVEEPLLETAEVIEAREEHIKEEEEKEEIPVAVHKIPAARPEPVERHMDVVPARPVAPVSFEEGVIVEHKVHKPRRRVRRGGNLVVAALLVAVGLMVVAIAFVGTGFAEQYMGTNPIIEYLGGSSSIKK